MERRGLLRIHVKHQLDIYGTICTGTGRLLNMSLGGCCLEADCVVVPGSIVNLFLTLLPGERRCPLPPATVRWINLPRMGVEFMSCRPNGERNWPDS